MNRPSSDEALYENQLSSGLCPQKTFAGQDIYLDGESIDNDEREARILAYWQPYHDKISETLEKIREQFASHHLEREPLSVRDRMVIVLNSISADRFTSFADFFDISEGRMGVVVSFLAILELLKESLIELVQSEPYAPIYIKARA